jgi:hypothetical protein
MVSENRESPIGLSELIEQVKQELLSTTPSQNDAPILCVDSVELQLQVTVRREDKGSLKVNVVSVLSGEMGDGVSRDDVHQVKVTLSPLFDKAQLVEWYKTLYPNEVLPSVKSSLDSLMKGEEGNLASRF